MLKAYKVEIRPNNEQIQIINQCGYRQKMPLYKRNYHCDNCGMIEDRDVNASINLKQAKTYTVIV